MVLWTCLVMLMLRLLSASLSTALLLLAPSKPNLFSLELGWQLCNLNQQQLVGLL